ncbi:hypothetical protein GOP47_0018245 [Adiantum capillus-veneris]|uniref:Uncharacterized protein n=1 Tax=Adiantum capillus-veneris TaxID=13818 RepID=A0A9D4ZBF1_ADICA|nr:hypothetical protein GOP47_0018245 [Adiantum capillus-veneris]
MGNYVSSCSCSCACIIPSSQRSKFAAAESKRKLERVIMVVHAVEERVIEMGGGAPMKVAELMLEYPGHFVVQCETDISSIAAAGMDMIKRATPLPADHEASPGSVYLLFPMHRMHTRVSPHESASYKGLLSSYIANSHLQQLLSCAKKKSLHSLMMQPTSAKVTPLFSLQLDEELPPHLTASADGSDGDAQIDDEIDVLLQQFCSATSSLVSNANGGAFMSKSGSLARSKSWIPKLETINESSILLA